MFIIFYHFYSGPLGCGDDVNQFAGRCYQFRANFSNWFEAREMCQQDGYDLVVIESQDESDYIKRKEFVYNT